MENDLMEDLGLQTNPDFIGAVLDTTQALIIVLDLSGNIILFNRACELATGYAFQEVYRKSFYEIFLPEKEIESVKRVLSGLKEGLPNFNENHWISRSGQQRLIAWNNTVMKDPDGKVIYIVSTGFDVTAVRRREEELLESRALYLQLFHNYHTPMLLVDPDTGQITTANPAASQYYGWNQEELIHKNIAEINLLPAKIIYEKLIKAGEASTSQDFIFQHRLANGEVRDVEVHSGPVKVNGKKYLLSIVHDITERKKDQEEIQKVSRFPAENPNPVLRISKDGELLYANQSSQVLLNEWNCRLGERIPERITRQVSPALAASGLAEIDIPCGEIIYQLLFVYIPETIDINIYGVDITSIRKAENELREYAEQLKITNEELRAYTTVVSHDLQEPLRKIKSFGNLLKNRYGNELGEEGNNYISRMVSASERMESMMCGLLNYSKLSSQELSLIPVDLSQVISAVISDLEIRLEETRGIIEIKSNLPVLMAEPTQVYELFQNLINNALKFRHPERIPEVLISAEQDHDLNGMVEITVQDNGIGFELQYLDRIFQPFQRLHGRSHYEGHGMGLAICKRIVERHGGAITAHSQPGKGSEFLVKLPIKTI
jgi:PAS domain S-box-containing protein